MKVIDLIIKQFNYELKDKTMFKVLNQENHDKYIYNIDDNKFHEHRVGSGEMENISLVIDKATIDWDIEIIEEDKQIEKFEINYAGDIEEVIFYEESDKPNHCILGDAGTELLINKINEIIDKVNELEKENE